MKKRLTTAAMIVTTTSLLGATTAVHAADPYDSLLEPILAHTLDGTADGAIALIREAVMNNPACAHVVCVRELNSNMWVVKGNMSGQALSAYFYQTWEPAAYMPQIEAENTCTTVPECKAERDAKEAAKAAEREAKAAENKALSDAATWQQALADCNKLPSWAGVIACRWDVK